MSVAALADRIVGLGRFRAAAAQTFAGYVSAGLGLLCEVVIALRYGANATTDLYRWASLAPFYLGAGVGAVLAPVFFRGRVLGEGRWVLLARLPSGRLAFSPWLRIAWFGSCGAEFSLGLLCTQIQDAQSVILMSVAAGLALLVFSVAAVPLFYAGEIWMFVAANGLLNLVLLLALGFSHGEFAKTLEIGFAVATALLLGLCFPVALCLRSQWVQDALEASAKDRSLGGAKATAPVVATHVSSILSVFIYFRALTAAGGGLLSLYSITQKMTLLLAVPGAALANKFLREQGIASLADAHRGVPTITRAVAPLVVAGPAFAVCAFGLLCAIYRVPPAGPIGLELSRACGLAAGVAALSQSATLLPLARVGGDKMIAGSLIAPLVAVFAAGVMLWGPCPGWRVSIPFLGAGLTGLASLLWVAFRTGTGVASSLVLVICCFVVAFGSAIALSSHWVEAWITGVWTYAAPLLNLMPRKSI